MALTYNAQARADIASYLSSVLSDGWMEIHDAAGDLLVRFHLPIAAFAARTGAYELAGQWFGTVQRDGVAASFSIADRNETWNIAGTVSGPGGSGDLKLASTALEFGSVVNITACKIEL